MAYPSATPEQKDFFNTHGWLVVEAAIPDADLALLESYGERILADKEKLAFDWAWSKDEQQDKRSFRIVQSSPSYLWKELREQAYQQWLVQFASDLMGIKLEFWYDQYLAKPPGKSVPTYWHQDEAYWGKNLEDRGITCWIPLHDVNADNGCMHFIDGGHKLGVIPHHSVESVQSDLLTCDVDESSTVVCPIKKGSVTFHHSKTPHMTTANVSQHWRKAVANHMQAIGAGGEGNHYPWKITVDQHTGKRFVPS